MTVQILGGGSDQSINAAAARFWQFNYSNNSSTSGGWGWIVAAAGTIDKLIVSLVTAPGAGKSVAFVLMVNGVASALTATISNTAVTASDTTHSVAVNAGDLISIRTTPAGTPTASRPSFAAQYTSTTATDAIWGGGGYLPTAAGTRYNSGGASWFNNVVATEAPERTVWPIAATITAFYVLLTGAPGAAKSWALTIYKNGVSQGTSTVTITGAVATTGNVTGLSISVAAGDVISTEIVPTGAPAVPNMAIGIAYTAATPGEWFINNIQVATNGGATATYYGPMAQIGEVGSTTEANKVYLIGAAAGAAAFSIRAIYVDQTPAPGAGKSYTTTLRINGADTNLAQTISGTNTSGNTAGAAIVQPGDAATFRWVGAGTPTTTTRQTWGLACGAPATLRARTLVGVGV